MKICSVFISDKSAKYFFKNFQISLNFSQNFEKIFSNFSKISPILSQNIFKIFCNFFLQISLLKLLKLFYLNFSLIRFYQTFHTKLKKFLCEVSIILSNFSQKFLQSFISFKERSEFIWQFYSFYFMFHW